MKKALRLKAHVIALLFTAVLAAPAQSQDYLVDSEFIISVPAFLLGVPPFVFAQFDIDYYKVTYNTVDVHGEPTVASGAIAVPVGGTTCDVFPMLMYCHGTVLRKQDVPSANNYESQFVKVFGGQGYVSIAPDYLGLGVNPGLHPYVHAQSQATASVDLFYAAREFVESLESVHLNGELFITGYSQGGHASMATLKYAQDNNLLEDMGIVAGAPLSGPYNMSGSQAEVLLSDEPYTNPGYVIYLLKSYQLAYGTLYAELSDIIQSPYDELVLPYFDGEQNEYDMEVVNALLPQQISELLVDTVLANLEANDNHPIWQALRDNDLYDWAPVMPLRLFYCDGDEQVPFANSIVARDSMLAKGATDVEASNVFPGADHVSCIVPAALAARLFFQSQATPCVMLTSTANRSGIQPLQVWPNPARGHLRMALPEARGTLTVYDLYGKLVAQRVVSTTEISLDIHHLSPAVYVVVYQNGEVVQRATVVVE